MARHAPAYALPVPRTIIRRHPRLSRRASGGGSGGGDGGGTGDGGTGGTGGTGGGATPTNAKLLGSNFEPLLDYTSMNWATIDVMKTSRPWFSGNSSTGEFDDGRTIATDADGWPTSFLTNQFARTLMLLNAGFPAGQYVVKWDGTGTVEANGPQVTPVSSAPKRIVVNIADSSDGLYLNILTTNPADHVRNVTVKHITYENSTEIWHPAFLADIAYYGTIRFMDMQMTNSTLAQNWTERATLTSARWGDKNGIPVEAMVDLCNKLNARPWFCMPHRATDAYITSFALLVKSLLKPALKPYVEWSNEAWNFQFPTAGYADTQANSDNARFRASGAAGWITWGSMRARQAHSCWETAYGGLGGFVRVYGAWTTYYYMTDLGLSFEGNGSHFDALAIAPYFGGNLAVISDGGPGTTTATYTQTQMLDALESILESSSFTHMDQNKTRADTYGLQLVCYEAGQHLVRVGSAGDPTDTNLDTLLVGIQNNSRMGGFYTALLNAWKTRGGGQGPLCHFQHAGDWGVFGSWGARQRLSIDVNSVPKAKALRDFALANLATP